MRFNIQQGESNDVFHDSTALQDINVLEDVVLFYSFISFFCERRKIYFGTENIWCSRKGN